MTLHAVEVPGTCARVISRHVCHDCRELQHLGSKPVRRCLEIICHTALGPGNSVPDSKCWYSTFICTIQLHCPRAFVRNHPNILTTEHTVPYGASGCVLSCMQTLLKPGDMAGIEAHGTVWT